VSQYVLAAVDDMFFASKIRAAAEHLRVEVRFVRSAEAALESARREKPLLVIVDLHSKLCDPFALAEALKADEQLRGLRLIGFFSHVQTALQRRAEQSGYDRVMPRSLFTKQLPEILRSGLKDT
jgi:CheY-like chemotaxis protein